MQGLRVLRVGLSFFLFPGTCIGCGACVDACPYKARMLEESAEHRGSVKITVNHEKYSVPAWISVLRALEFIGFTSYIYKEGELSDTELLAPCRTGGCWACATIINHELKPSCVTPVAEGMEIITNRDEIAKIEPKRIVSEFQGHAVGGVGTPHWVKPRTFGFRCIEIVCFSHGCILRCPTCQNWKITYSAVEEPLSPVEAARIMTYERRWHNVHRMAIWVVNAH